MTADYIAEHDGQTYTMLLSENLQAGGWACDPGKPILAAGKRVSDARGHELRVVCHRAAE